MKAVIYSSTALPEIKGVPKFNASHFPCHGPDVDTVFLNGEYPEIQALCEGEGLTVKPLSEYKIPKSKSEKVK